MRLNEAAGIAAGAMIGLSFCFPVPGVLLAEGAGYFVMNLKNAANDTAKSANDTKIIVDASVKTVVTTAKAVTRASVAIAKEVPVVSKYFRVLVLGGLGAAAGCISSNFYSISNSCGGVCSEVTKTAGAILHAGRFINFWRPDFAFQ